MNPTKAIDLHLRSTAHQFHTRTVGCIGDDSIEDDSYVIRLDRGVVHSNGFKECKLRSPHTTK